MRRVVKVDGRSETIRMPRESGPKAWSRVGNAILLFFRSSRETVTGLTVDMLGVKGRVAIKENVCVYKTKSW